MQMLSRFGVVEPMYYGVEVATGTIISVEEYLALPPREPDVEYVRGEVVERAMPNYTRGQIQMMLGVLLFALRRFGLYASSEVRLRLAPDLYRLPDVSVFAGKPTEAYPSHPPLIAIEIVSPDDTYSDMLAKLADYRDWGVTHIWVVDPNVSKLFLFDGALREVPSFELSGYAFSITLADILQ